METIIPAIKDAENERSVPTSWRPIFSDIVKAFVAQDYRISYGIENVAMINSETAKQIQEYIEDYGEQLVPLPEETWETSIYLWQGNYWDVIIDLWTAGEGRSDMILSAKVTEKEGTYNINVYMVYVP